MKDLHLIRFIEVLCLAAYLWIGINLAQGVHSHPPAVCLFKSVTGLPCPSCGTTRSIIQLSHGDFVNAVQTNPLGVVAGIGLVLIPVWLLIDRLRQTSTFIRAWHTAESLLVQKRWVAATFIMVIAANWGWNIVKGL